MDVESLALGRCLAGLWATDVDNDSASAPGSEPSVPAKPRMPYSERPAARARRAKAQELIERLVAEERVRIADPDDDEDRVPPCGVAAIKEKLQVAPQADSSRRHHCLTTRQVWVVVVTAIAAPVGLALKKAASKLASQCLGQ
ncbi:hypothetical protein [Streptomyces sp. NPDC055186]